jgi:hypothetical protein
VDHQLGPIAVSNDADDLEQRTAAARPQLEPKVAVKVVGRHRVSYGVLDVVDGDVVPACRRRDIHTTKSYYET